MVKTALVETLEVPTTTWSVTVCCKTKVPESAKPETFEAEMDPQRILPVASVVKAEEALLLTIKLVIVVEPAAKVEEERSTPETWKLPPTVEEAEEINPPEAFKAKMVSEAKFWTAKALPSWPSKVRSARLME